MFGREFQQNLQRRCQQMHGLFLVSAEFPGDLERLTEQSALLSEDLPREGSDSTAVPRVAHPVKASQPNRSSKLTPFSSFHSASFESVEVPLLSSSHFRSSRCRHAPSRFKHQLSPPISSLFDIQNPEIPSTSIE